MATVLVVDDSVTMRRMIMAALGSAGDLTFEQAESGLGAIERVTITPVDLVVLDLNMPDVHGIEVLKFIRTHSSLSQLPVIVLTTRGDSQSRAAALEAGATTYLTKPFQPAVFAQEVRRLLAA